MLSIKFVQSKKICVHLKQIATAKLLATRCTITTSRRVLYLAVYSVTSHAPCRWLLLVPVINNMFVLLYIVVFIGASVLIVVTVSALVSYSSHCFTFLCWLTVASTSLGTLLMEASSYA